MARRTTQCAMQGTIERKHTVSFSIETAKSVEVDSKCTLATTSRMNLQKLVDAITEVEDGIKRSLLHHGVTPNNVLMQTGISNTTSVMVNVNKADTGQTLSIMATYGWNVTGFSAKSSVRQNGEVSILYFEAPIPSRIIAAKSESK